MLLEAWQAFPKFMNPKESVDMRMVQLFQKTTLSLCFLLPIAALAAAGVGDASSEIWIDGVDTTPPGAQPANPDATVDHAGRSIFVWDASATSRQEVFMRRFDEYNKAMGDPVQVNTFDVQAQHNPRVAASSDNSFLVVWRSSEIPSTNPTVHRDVVRSQLFDADANPVGEEQLLSRLEPLLATGGAPTDVAALKNGGYIVVWRSSQSANEADTSTTIQARRIGANGVPLGDQFQVNSLISSVSENYPAVAALADGGFIATWTAPQVHGRRFMANGTPVGDDFQINTFEEGGESTPDVAVNDDGRVLVTWTDPEESGEFGREIRGRMYSASLAALGPDFRINILMEGEQYFGRVANYGENGFFVAWESASSAGDGEPNSIEGRIVTGSNQFTGTQFLVNQYTESSQQSPGIGGRNGLVAVAWDSRRGNPETSISTIQGMVWSICGIFCDGFE